MTNVWLDRIWSWRLTGTPVASSQHVSSQSRSWRRVLSRGARSPSCTPMSRHYILTNLAETYATCSSYQDTGAVVTRYVHLDGCRSTDRKLFTTAFVRPGWFRYVCKHRFLPDEPWDQLLVWARASEVRMWWDVNPGVNRRAWLGRELQKAAGASGGSAITIPALLMPDRVGGPRLTEMEGVEELDPEPLGEVVCHRLRGRFGQLEQAEQSPRTVWVEQETLLVLRIEQSVRSENFSAERVTTYAPRLNEPIPAEDLRFNPPPP